MRDADTDLRAFYAITVLNVQYYAGKGGANMSTALLLLGGATRLLCLRTG